MNPLLKAPLAATVTALLLTAPMLSVGQAEETEKSNPLRFYQGEKANTFLQASVGADLAYFSEDNAYFGSSQAVLGDDVDSWWESLVRLGLEGSYVLPGSQSLYGKVDAVQANTFGGTDVGATNLVEGDVHSLRIDKAYAGWRSGNLFGSLGEDFLDISFGRQIYTVGNGFLFASEGEGGYKRAAWYLGGRKSADWAGIVTIKSGAWSGDLFYFEADRINDFTEMHFADFNTRAGGATVNYAFTDSTYLGGSLFTLDSDDLTRDGMNVANMRGAVKPFELAKGPEALQPLKFEAEMAVEDKDNDQDDGTGWYIATSYQFEKVWSKPELTYRYASFDEDYDPLFYGGTDWGTWYQGEIVGEYALSNNNLDTHMFRLKVQPIEPLTVNLFYFIFNLHEADAYGVSSDKYGDEWNLIFDWAATDSLTLSLVGAVATPDDGAKQMYGGDDNWTSVMLYGCVRF